jgi:hypothetical protein
MIAANKTISAYDVGREFAVLLNGDQSVKKLWVRGSEDHIDIWLLTKPISYEHRLQIRSLKRRLYERFSESNLAVELHIEHAGLYDVEPGQFRFEAPLGARSINVR